METQQEEARLGLHEVEQTHEEVRLNAVARALVVARLHAAVHVAGATREEEGLGVEEQTRNQTKRLWTQNWRNICQRVKHTSTTSWTVTWLRKETRKQLLERS